MNEQLTDIEVAEFADFPYTPAERKLAREVQASRKLIADLRALVTSAEAIAATQPDTNEGD